MLMLASDSVLFYSFVMEMPELDPRNHVEIYSYFKSFEPNPHITNLGFAALHLPNRDDVRFVDGANDVIQEHLDCGGKLLLTANHTSNVDTRTIANLVYAEVFSSLKGTTTIPAKAEIFGWPGIGKIVPHLLAHPVFQGKDFRKLDLGEPDLKQLIKECGDEVVDFNTWFINKGGNAAMFSEGHRNRGDPRKIQKILPGIGRIATGVSNPENLLVVTTGFAYRWSRAKSPKIKLRPLVVVNNPFSPAGMSQEKVLERTSKDMQDAVTLAYDLAA